ncbi:DUF7128 family protein [Natrinema pallidum]
MPGETPVLVRIHRLPWLSRRSTTTPPGTSCETCRRLFDEQSDAAAHEKQCDGSGPTDIRQRLLESVAVLGREFAGPLERVGLRPADAVAVPIG